MVMIACYVNRMHTIEPFTEERKRDGQTVFMLIGPIIHNVRAARMCALCMYWDDHIMFVFNETENIFLC